MIERMFFCSLIVITFEKRKEADRVSLEKLDPGVRDLLLIARIRDCPCKNASAFRADHGFKRSPVEPTPPNASGDGVEE